MNVQRCLLIPFAILAIVACNFPLFAPATAAAPPISPPLASAVPPPVEPAATATAVPTPTPIPTPSVPQVTPISVNVNCRSGPDVGYDATSVLMFGQTTQIAGRNEDSSWWYVRDPSNPSGFCWVAASVVTTAGNLAGLPFIAPPAAIVTNVTVDVSVPSTIYCGGPNPLEFSGSITTNGAAKVKFQWEVGGDKSNTTTPQTLNFNKAGTKDAPSPGAYNVDCGNYTITLHVLSPNDMSAKKKFKVQP